MRKFFIISLLILAVIVHAAPAFADGNVSGTGGSNTGTNSFLDFLSLLTGCGTPPTTSCTDDPTNGIFSAVACRAMKAFNTGVAPLYCNIVTNPVYLQAIDAAMMLYVILLGFSFLMGLVPMKAGTLVGKLLKATIVYALIINADIYFNVVYNTVLQGTHDIVRIMLNSPTGASTGGAGKEDFFQYVDGVMAKILNSVYQTTGAENSGQTYSKTNMKIFMIGIAIWQLGGDIPGGLFFAVIIGWIVNYFSIMIRYLLAMLSLMFLLMLGPLFLPTLLFKQTENMGEEWIFMILSFMMQIILVIGFVLMVQGFFVDFYHMIEKGLNNPAVMQDSMDTVSMPYKDETNPENNGAVGLVKRTNSMGYTPQAAQQYFQTVFGADYKQELPKMIFKLLEMVVIITFSSMFMKVVPSLAGFLVARPRFVRIFLGQKFGPDDKMDQGFLRPGAGEGGSDKGNTQAGLNEVRGQ